MRPTNERMLVQLQLRADRECDVRRATVTATVDTSVPLLTLPQDLAELARQHRLVDGGDLVRQRVEQMQNLGLGEWRSAPSRPRRRGAVGPVTVRIGDEETVMDCLVGPPGTEPVVGSTVLAVLNLIADEATGTVKPGHGVRI